MSDELQVAIDNLKAKLDPEIPEEVEVLGNVEALKLPSFAEISKVLGQIQQLLSIIQAVLPKG